MTNFINLDYLIFAIFCLLFLIIGLYLFLISWGYSSSSTHIYYLLSKNHRQRKLENSIFTHFTAMYDKRNLYAFNSRGQLIDIYKNDMSIIEFVIKLIFYKTLEFFSKQDN